MRCVVFELAGGGGGTYVPPGRAKVAQTPGRARVKGISARDGWLKHECFSTSALITHQVRQYP